MLSQLLFTIPNLYDAIWLGKLGAGAQSAAGLATAVRVTMISVLMALSGASGAVVARYVGAKDRENADLATLQGVLLMLVASGSLGAIGFIFAGPLMRLAGADAEVFPLAVRYARILFAGLIAMEMVPSVGGMVSTAGVPRLRLTMMSWTLGTMLIAEPLLVNALGLEGAVLALVSAHVAGTVWGLGALLSGRMAVRIDVHNLRLDFPMMWRILRITLPAILQRGIPNFGMSVLMRFISAYGAETLAAWVVVTRVFSLAQVPGMGVSQVTAAMVGQNLGARRPQRAEQSVRLIAHAVTGVTTLILVGLMLFAPSAMSLFTQDVVSIATGAYIIRLLSVGYLAQALTAVFDSALSGAGNTVSPMLINMVLWTIQLPLAYMLSRVAGMNADGIWLALLLVWLAQTGLIWKRYRRGDWKQWQI